MATIMAENRGPNRRGVREVKVAPCAATGEKRSLLNGDIVIVPPSELPNMRRWHNLRPSSMSQEQSQSITIAVRHGAVRHRAQLMACISLLNFQTQYSPDERLTHDDQGAETRLRRSHSGLPLWVTSQAHTSAIKD